MNLQSNFIYILNITNSVSPGPVETPLLKDFVSLEPNPEKATAFYTNHLQVSEISTENNLGNLKENVIVFTLGIRTSYLSTILSNVEKIRLTVCWCI